MSNYQYLKGQMDDDDYDGYDYNDDEYDGDWKSKKKQKKLKKQNKKLKMKLKKQKRENIINNKALAKCRMQTLKTHNPKNDRVRVPYISDLGSKNNHERYINDEIVKYVGDKLYNNRYRGR